MIPETPTTPPVPVSAESADSPSWLQWQKQHRVRIAVSFLMMMLALYLLIAIVSFFACWQVDQNFLEHREWADKARNLGGQLGNLLAALLVSKVFGLSAICIPFMLAWVSLCVFLQKSLAALFKPLVGITLGMILLSLTFGVFLGNQAHLGSGLGGGHGYVVGFLFMVATFGKAGAIILLLLAYSALCYFFVPQRACVFVYTKVRSLIDPKFRAAQPVAVAATAASEVAPPLVEDEPVVVPVEGNKEGNKEQPMKTPAEIKITVVDTYDEEQTPPQPQPQEPQPQQQIPAPPQLEPTGEKEELDWEVTGEGDVPEADELTEAQLPYDPKRDLSLYVHPTPDLLDDYQKGSRSVSAEELEENKNRIVRTLGHHNIAISEIKATIGPTITLYEIVPAPGIRIAKIKGLENDIALSLAALGIRIIAPMPGKGTIGIEVPNQNPEIVPMQAIIKSAEFQDSKYDIPIALGKTITNKAFVVDLAKMPHLLIAGATGQGKSVGLNAVLVSLLYKMHPAQLKLVLVDPKKVELPLYAKIENHFLAKLPDAEDAIITDNQKVIYTINSLCIEMDARYELLKNAGVRNLKEYNQKFIDRHLNPQKGHRYLPYIVLVIDEFADLIMTAGKEIEVPIARLAQLARAIGIHLIIATQRPTTNIITGMIKANFPARIAFRVTSVIDSRTILDQSGAQQLIGKGDMLVSTGSDLVRVQCAFVDLHEVERITEFIGKQQSYNMAHILPEYAPPGDENKFDNVDLGKRDPLFAAAARLIVDTQQGSTSLIQRKMELGYNRAGKIMDQLEAAGIVGPQEGSKPRQVRVIDPQTLEQILDING